LDVEGICGTALDLRQSQDDKGRRAKRIKEKLEPSWMLSLSVEPPWISVDWAGRRRERIDVK